MSTRWLRCTIVPLAAVILAPPALRGNEPSSPLWGRIPHLSAALASQADCYLEHRDEFVSVETARSTRYRNERPRRATSFGRPLPGLPYGDETTPEFRLRTEHQESRARKRVSRKLSVFPSPHDWAALFSAKNQPFFMFRELGTRLEGFDFVREIRFRGALPFTDGRDIREWEGVALVEASLLRVVEIRARPLNQEDRLRFLYDRWSRSFKITFGIFAGPFFIPGPTLRFARRPLAYRCFVRFDDRKEQIWLPTLMSCEIRQAVSPERTVLRTLSTRHYMNTKRDIPLQSRSVWAPTWEATDSLSTETLPSLASRTE
jgi:hypothetical protein